jgi:hypothetical protein
MIIAMLILLVPIAVFTMETVAETPANYGQVDAGSAENPYLISNLANLRWLSETRSVWGSETQRYYFKQTAEIDAAETRNWNEGRGFSPIGEMKIPETFNGGDEIDHEKLLYLHFTSAFWGTYDGGSYPIRNVFMSQTGDVEKSFIGFFGTIKNAEIKSVRLENILYIVDNTVVGSLCHYAYQSNFSNSTVSGTIIMKDPSKPIEFRGSSASGFVADSIKSTIDKCFSEVNIINVGDSTNKSYGMIRTFNNSTLSNSYYRGVIFNPSSDSAGLVGFLGESKIQNSYSSITTNSPVSGLIHTPHGSSIVNSYFHKTANVKHTFPGSTQIRLTKFLTKDFFLAEYSGKGLSERNMKNTRSFKGWDFDNIWSIDPNINDGFPHLRMAR